MKAITRLERDAGIVFLGTMIANAGSYAFHVVLSRHLGPPSYGVLGAVVAIATAVAIPAAGLQYTVARRVAIGDEDAARAGLRLGIGVGLVLTMVTVLTLPVLPRFLHTSSAPLAWLALGMIPFGALPAFTGVLQGRRHFGALATTLCVVGLGRALGAVLVALLGLGVAAGVAVMSLSTLAAVAVAGWSVGPLRGLATGVSLRAEVLRTAVPFLAVATVSSLDVVLARHYLAPTAAGQYAAASIAGKIMLWAPAAVAVTTFPHFADRANDARATLARALRMLAAICSAALVGTVILREPLIGTVFGARYLPAADVIVIVAVAMTALAIVHVLATFAVARGTYFIGPALLAGPVVLVAATVLRHGSPRAVALDVLGAVGVALVIAVVLTRVSLRNGADAPTTNSIPGSPL